MGRSVSFNPTPSVCTMPSKSNSHSTASVTHRVHGLAEGPLTNIVLPYMIDYWHNRQPAKQASIQMHMLSGNDKLLDRVSYRVSTSQNELIVTIEVEFTDLETDASFCEDQVWDCVIACINYESENISFKTIKKETKVTKE